MASPSCFQESLVGVKEEDLEDRSLLNHEQWMERNEHAFLLAGLSLPSSEHREDLGSTHQLPGAAVRPHSWVSGNHHQPLCSWQGYTILRILVENRGRVNYGNNIDDQRKGGS